MWPNYDKPHQLYKLHEQWNSIFLLRRCVMHIECMRLWHSLQQIFIFQLFTICIFAYFLFFSIMIIDMIIMDVNLIIYLNIIDMHESYEHTYYCMYEYVYFVIEKKEICNFMGCLEFPQIRKINGEETTKKCILKIKFQLIETKWIHAWSYIIIIIRNIYFE